MRNENSYTPLEAMSIRKLGKNEGWLQDIIAENPEILGLGGEVELLNKERNQPSGGRLDILLKKESSNERFELEIQLGTTDETHIVRTLEYWDIERRRYPGIDHVAVIAAEEVSGRFFNVIGLFGNHIPLIALRVAAFQLPDGQIGVHFFKVLDTRGLTAASLDDEGASESADADYWIGRCGEKQLKFAQQIIKEIADEEPNYTKWYIGIIKNGIKTARFMVAPRKNSVWVHFALPESDELTNRFSEKAIYVNYQRGIYRFRLSSAQELQSEKRLLRDLFLQAIGDEPPPVADQTTSEDAQQNAT